MSPTALDDGPRSPGRLLAAVVRKVVAALHSYLDTPRTEAVGGAHAAPHPLPLRCSRYFLACGPLNWLAALAVLSAVSVPLTAEPLMANKSVTWAAASDI